MIRVKIELVPRGVEARAREIGRLYIANDGTGDAERGAYKVAVCRRGATDVPREIYRDEDRTRIESTDGKKLPKAARTGEVKDYPRLAYNVWRLVARALLASFPEEDKAPKQRRTTFDRLVARGFELLAQPVHAALAHNQDLTLPQSEDGDALRAVLDWLAAATNDA